MKAVKAELIWNGERFLSGSAILMEGARIARVVPAEQVMTPQIEDWGSVAIVPGTVNAHGHAFQSLLKGFADDRPFESWRDDVLYPFSERLDKRAIYVGALFAFAEGLLAGATTTVDFFYLHDEGNENALEVARAARDVGIRLVLARTFYDTDATTRAPKRYREEAAAAATRTLELARAIEDPSITVQPAPHSLHAASIETIGRAQEVARELGVPCHLHLAEAAYERQQVQERYGTTPVRLLHKEGLLNGDLIAIHAVWLDEEELDLVAESGCGIVHCPGANAFLGDGIAPLPEMLRRGIRVGLGPDGGCANNRQSVFDEMRSASLLAKARLTDGGALDAATAFKLGTAGGADLLGLGVGAIEAGRSADLVALDLNDLSLAPTSMLERNIVNSMQSTAIAKVMVGGELVVDKGRLMRIANEDIGAMVGEVTSGWQRP